MQKRNHHRLRLSAEQLEPRMVLAGFQSAVISEIAAINDSSLADEDGDFSDWIEIYNPTTDAIDLAGWYLTDDASELTKWQFPTQVLNSGDYLVVFASSKDRTTGSQLHTNFKLSGDGEYLALIKSDATSIADEFAPKYPKQADDISYGIGQEITTLIPVGASASFHVPNDDSAALQWTLPSFDDTNWSSLTTGIGYERGPGQGSATAYGTQAGAVGTQNFSGSLGMDFDVNQSVTVTELGVFDSGSDGLFRTITSQIWSRNGNSGTLLAELTFTPGDAGTLLGSDRFKLLGTELTLDPGAYTIVAYGYGNEELNGNTGGPADSEKTLDDGGGTLSFVGGARFGSAGAFPSSPDGGPVNRYAAGTFKYVTPAYSELITSDVEVALYDQNSSAYVRIEFNVTDPNEFASLNLLMQYDDGFVAYLNGDEIANRNAPALVDWDSTATISREAVDATAIETINISSFIDSLQVGTNVLAIHGLNADSQDDDFLLVPQLLAIQTTEASGRIYFDNPTPGAPNDSSSSFLGFVDALSFSAERGFYDQSFQLQISTTAPDVMIRYTTSAVAPTATTGTIYTGPILIDATTTLSVAAYKTDLVPTDVVTQTYLFLDDVIHQSGVPAGYPSTWKGLTADYDISQNTTDLPLIAGDPNFTIAEAEQAIKDSLKSIPTLSIVLPQEDLFDANNGIYANPAARGDAWERAASIEYLLPDGSERFQVNAGIQIMGFTSRNLSFNPKLSMRIVFKKEYGPGRLNYQFFENNPVDSFNTITLRSNGRDNWGFTSGATYIRDQFAKVSQAEMGQLAISGNFVHLYLNGLYWGIYNPTERPDAAFAEEHIGGDDDDYDTVKFCCPQRAVDGNLSKWNELRSLAAAGLSSDAAYQFIQGNNPDGTRNENYEVLIDIDNFIDYVINGQFVGSGDWPGNYYVLRDRTADSEGFQFFTWDNDLALPSVGADKVTPAVGHNWWTESPGEFDIALRANAEYRLKFADRVHQQYFNGGSLTPVAALDRWNRLADEVRDALIAESARWGDYRGGLDTPSNQWENSIASVANFFTTRSDVVLNQLRTNLLYPTIEAPVFSQHGGAVDFGFQLEMQTDEETTFIDTTLLTEFSPAKAWVPIDNRHDPISPAVIPEWTLSAFDDTSWIEGAGGVGYERGAGYQALIGIDLLDTNIPADMRIDSNGDGLNNNNSVFTRFEFNVDAGFNATDYDRMLLKMKFDDGFVAYLNGTKVTSVFEPSPLVWNSTSGGANEASTSSFDEFDITQHLNLLVAGQTNVLAIHGMNVALNSSDMIISPELIISEQQTIITTPIWYTTDGSDPRDADTDLPQSGVAIQYTGGFPLTESMLVNSRTLVNGTWSALNAAFFTVQSPLQISELMFNAPGDDAVEFVELVNTGDQPLSATSLNGITFTKGIDFSFTGETEPLPAGEHLVVVRDQTAFAALYNTDNIRIANGQYGNGTSDDNFALDNGGETLRLEDAGGGLIQEFRYDDKTSEGWYSEADGEGFSLVVITTTGDYNAPANWRSSALAGGSPGVVDLPALDADFNGDGLVDAIDLGILLQNYGTSSNANRAVGDANRDQQVNLHDLLKLKQLFNSSIFSAPQPSAAALYTSIEKETAEISTPLLITNNLLRTHAKISRENHIPRRKVSVSSKVAAIDQVHEMQIDHSVLQINPKSIFRAHRGHSRQQINTRPPHPKRL